MNIFSKKKIYISFFACNLFSLPLFSAMVPSGPLSSRKFGTQSLDNDRAGNAAERNFDRVIVPAQPLNCSLDSFFVGERVWVHPGSQGSNNFICDLQEIQPRVFLVTAQPEQQIQSMPRTIECEEEMEFQSDFFPKQFAKGEKLNLFPILRSSLDFYDMYEQIVLALVANPFCPVLGQDSDGRTPIHYAIAWPDLGIVDLFMNEFGEFVVNVPDKHGLTVFHYAVRSKIPSKVQYLLTKCQGIIDVNLEDKEGKTPLMMVVDDAVSNRPAAREGRKGTERCKGAGSWNITQEMMKILVKYSSTENLTKVLTIANTNKKNLSRTLQLEWKRCVTTVLTSELFRRRIKETV